MVARAAVTAQQQRRLLPYLRLRVQDSADRPTDIDMMTLHWIWILDADGMARFCSSHLSIQCHPSAAAPPDSKQHTESSQTSYLATALTSAIISSRNGTTIASSTTASRFSRLFPIHHQPQPFSSAIPSDCGRYLWIG